MRTSARAHVCVGVGARVRPCPWAYVAVTRLKGIIKMSHPECLFCTGRFSGVHNGKGQPVCRHG